MTTEKTYNVSETVTFTKRIEATSKEGAMNTFIEDMHDLVFGDSAEGFEDISEGVKIEEVNND
mgnify:CR=1 FL=1